MRRQSFENLGHPHWTMHAYADVRNACKLHMPSPCASTSGLRGTEWKPMHLGSDSNAEIARSCPRAGGRDPCLRICTGRDCPGHRHQLWAMYGVVVSAKASRVCAYACSCSADKGDISNTSSLLTGSRISAVPDTGEIARHFKCRSSSIV